MQTKIPAYNYYKATLTQANAVLQLHDAKELMRYTLQFNLTNILLLQKETTDYFACLHQSAILCCPTLGYKTIQDYLQGQQNNFPDAEKFYKATAQGVSNYHDYVLVDEAGIADAKIVEKMKTQGYVTGYAEFKELLTQNVPLETNQILNPYHLYTYCTQNGFTDFAHFKAAWNKGFTNAKIYTTAKEKGFKNAADYNASQKAGFIHGVDFYMAQELNIRDVHDFQKYLDLDYLKNQNLTHDKRVLIGLLSKLPQNKKISINKLNELLLPAIQSYTYSDTGTLPPWFSQSLQQPTDITKFLSENNNVKKFGTYDSEGEYFETKRLNQRKVVIDGANIAHNSKNSEKIKPTVANMLLMVNALKQKGFTEITIIADASLRHRLADKEKISELEKACDYLQAPAENPADVFLINYVKLHRCLLITNDVFRDWKTKDAWVAENIDYYKMSFMIDHNIVLLPDLETA